MNRKVYDRPINTLQTMFDNSKIGDYMTIYEDGDNQVVVNSELPKRLLYPFAPYERGIVKVPKNQKIMIFNEESRKVECLGPQAVFEYLLGCDIFDTDMNCTIEQLHQVLLYLKELGAQFDEKIFY